MTEWQSRIFEPNVPRKKLLGQMIWFIIWLAITVIGAFILKASPQGHATHTQLGLPPCPSVLLFDRPCPGCGLTTSWTATMHGQVVRAFTAHPFGPLMYLGFTGSALLSIYGWFKGLRLRTEGKRLNSFLTVFLVVFVSFGIIRFITHPYHSTYWIGNWTQGSASRSEQSRDASGVPKNDSSADGLASGQVE